MIDSADENGSRGGGQIFVINVIAYFFGVLYTYGFHKNQNETPLLRRLIRFPRFSQILPFPHPELLTLTGLFPWLFGSSHVRALLFFSPDSPCSHNAQTVGMQSVGMIALCKPGTSTASAVSGARGGRAGRRGAQCGQIRDKTDETSAF